MIELVDLVETIASDEHHQKKNFLVDVVQGLSQDRKQISSKYFYDDKGSLLFNQITRHPDYYLTQCEIEILNASYQYFINLLQEEFNLIELGPGEAIKTEYLLKPLSQQGLSFEYMPIDISLKYLKNLQSLFGKRFHNINGKAIHTDYLKGLEWIAKQSRKRNFILFLGSSIGNYNLANAKNFLQQIHQVVNKGDYLLIGFDLRKDVRTLMRAYDDDRGITRDFNLNLLNRINHELAANFDINQFYHYATYNVYSGAMESYLISLNRQNVYIAAADKNFEFINYEAIHVEYSYKYLLTQVRELAATCGFKILRNFTDTKEYFVDSLWQVVK